MTSRRRLVALLSLLAATMAIGVATRWGDLRRWHARNLLESGDGAGGLAILQSEVERDPDDPDLRLELAIVLLSSGAPAKAEPHLEILAATPEIPERVPAFRALARIARDRKDWTREREILRAFAIAVPEDRQACLDLGDVDDRLEAEDADILERAAVRFADDDSILAYFARSVRRKGDPERALALVRDRLRRPDPPAWFFSEAARLLLLKSDQAAALNVASDAVRRFPDDPDLWGVLAAAEFHSGHATKSLAAYRRAAALEPHNRPYVDAIVYLLSRTGRAEEALRVLRDFETRASPEDAPLVAAAIRSVVRQTRSGHAPARVEIRLSADLPAGIDSASLCRSLIPCRAT
jgi:tetratricopeptide (TPR) repeat protein